MADNKKNITMTPIEIGSLISKLTPSNQAYLLNTINALLLSQQTTKLHYQAKKECNLHKNKDEFNV